MFSPEDVKHMTLALELAEEAAANGEVPIGAVIVQSGEQIASAKNRMEELCSATAHAEILAINEAGQNLKNWRLDGATLYVSLEPCHMCWGAIKNSRISRVVFAAKDMRKKEPETWDITVEDSLLEKESTEILQKFFRNVRRIKNDSGNKGLGEPGSQILYN
ncbi:MAG: nucleoside deaminase [Candidatus Fibromonas sp.]|jgi:tRNA(adenine34) deaminase|nr:nucleoside deaminase [Candidatus Fibromonas sp.]